MNKQQSKTLKIENIIIVSAIIVVILWLSSLILIPIFLDSWTNRGTFEDMFGAVNALFSGLAFAGVIIALFLQKHELSLQREELEATREELKGQKEQLKLQNRTFEKQAFEGERVKPKQYTLQEGYERPTRG